MSQNYQVDTIEAFNDNYIWSIRRPGESYCVVVDPGSSKDVLNYLNKQQLNLVAILITHHHKDHTGGVRKLVQKYPNIPVYGPTVEAQDVVTRPLKDGDSINIQECRLNFDVIDVPGHTLGHIAFVDDYSLFCGDTLFSGGCGRMFEGTPEQFQQSLVKLASLQPHINVYCAHEYTLSNLEFSKSVTPSSSALHNYHKECVATRVQNKPTIPSTINTELAINPFLRLDHVEVIESLNRQFNIKLTNNLAENFKWLRQWKDNF